MTAPMEGAGGYDAHTALIVVDVQNDFADPGGGLAVDGGEAVVGACNREIELARRADGLVVYTQDWHPEVTSHFAKTSSWTWRHR